MNFYEALVMATYGLVCIALAVCNYRAQLRADAAQKKVSALSVENEKLKAENKRLKASKRCESLFIEFAHDAMNKDFKK